MKILSISIVSLLFFLGLSGYPLEARHPEPVEGKVSQTITISLGHLMKGIEYISSDFEGFQHLGGASFQLTLPEKSGLYFVDLHLISPEEERLLGLPLLVREKLSHTFKHTPLYEVGTIALAGSFNHWRTDRNFLQDEDGDGIYSLTKELSPGRHIYKFVIDGNWLQNMANPLSEPDGFGGFNSVVEMEVPKFPAIYGVSEEIVDGNWEVKFVASKDADYQKMFAFFLGEKWTESFRQSAVTLTLPVGEGLENLFIWAKDADGNITDTKRVLKNFSTDLSWPERIIYSIVVDRFYNADPANDSPVVDNPLLPAKSNFKGGDWMGIIQKIEEGYFARLGVCILWISPVNNNPPQAWRDYLSPHRYWSGFHGYWPISHVEVEENFGTKEELKKLIDTANERGMKVMADMVFNHVHQDHPWHKEHPEWFGTLELPDGRKNIRQFDKHPFTTWFDGFLPSFDFCASPEAVEAVVDNAIWWIEKFGFDALRLDAVKHIPHHFWQSLSERINLLELETGICFFLVGETIDSRDVINTFLVPGGMDGQFDFPLHWHARNVFALGESNFHVLSAELASSMSIYSDIYHMATLIGSHDKPRFISFADGDIVGVANGWVSPPEVDNPLSYQRLKLAFTFLLTNPGIPKIYYGDEIGMPGAADPDNRRMMRFTGLSDEQQSVFEHVSLLNKHRRGSLALTMGWHRDLLVEDDLWAYLKHRFDCKVIVVLNNSLEEKKFDLNLPEEIIADGMSFKDIFSGQVYTVENGSLQGSVQPLGALVMNVIGE